MALSNNASTKEVMDTFEQINNKIIARGGAQTITPGTSNKILNAGYYSGDITVAGDGNLIASNIRSGKNIFGVVGTLVEGKRYATGIVTASRKYISTGGANYGDGYTFNLNLPFIPSVILYGIESTDEAVYLKKVCTIIKSMKFNVGPSYIIDNGNNLTLVYEKIRVGESLTSVNIKWLAYE